MASMTDYMQKILQESTEVEVEKSEEELSTAILESYLSMSAAFTTIENAIECANIIAFCEAAEIDKPAAAAVVVESFWDSVKNVFETIIDWFRSVIQGFIGLFTSAKLQKLIAKLKTLDNKKVVKIDNNRKIAFNIDGSNFTIQCNEKEKMNDVIKSLSSKKDIDLSSSKFFYSGDILKRNLTFDDIANSDDKKRNQMNIVGYTFEDDLEDEEKFVKSKDIICPKCKGLCKINIYDYKIALYECKNNSNHKISNILFTEFDNTQMINYQF